MIRAIRTANPDGSDPKFLPVCLTVGNALPILAATQAISGAGNAGLLQDFAVDTGIVFG